MRLAMPVPVKHQPKRGGRTAQKKTSLPSVTSKVSKAFVEERLDSAVQRPQRPSSEPGPSSPAVPRTAATAGTTLSASAASTAMLDGDGRLLELTMTYGTSMMPVMAASVHSGKVEPKRKAIIRRQINNGMQKLDALIQRAETAKSARSRSVSPKRVPVLFPKRGRQRSLSAPVKPTVKRSRSVSRTRSRSVSRARPSPSPPKKVVTKARLTADAKHHAERMAKAKALMQRSKSLPVISPKMRRAIASRRHSTFDGRGRSKSRSPERSRRSSVQQQPRRPGAPTALQPLVNAPTVPAASTSAPPRQQQVSYTQQQHQQQQEPSPRRGASSFVTQMDDDEFDLGDEAASPTHGSHSPTSPSRDRLPHLQSPKREDRPDTTASAELIRARLYGLSAAQSVADFNIDFEDARLEEDPPEETRSDFLPPLKRTDTEYAVKTSDFMLTLDVMGNLEKALRMPEFRELSFVGLKAVLSSDDLVVDSENTVFLALQMWLHSHRHEQALMEKLLPLVRWAHIDLHYVCDVIEPLANRGVYPKLKDFLYEAFRYNTVDGVRIIKDYAMEKRFFVRKHYKEVSDIVYTWQIPNAASAVAAGFRSDLFLLRGYQWSVLSLLRGGSMRMGLFERNYKQNKKMRVPCLYTFSAKSASTGEYVPVGKPDGFRDISVLIHPTHDLLSAEAGFLIDGALSLQIHLQIFSHFPEELEV